MRFQSETSVFKFIQRSGQVVRLDFLEISKTLDVMWNAFEQNRTTLLVCEFYSVICVHVCLIGVLVKS